MTKPDDLPFSMYCLIQNLSPHSYRRYVRRKSVVDSPIQKTMQVVSPFDGWKRLASSDSLVSRPSRESRAACFMTP
jgi:hypothetical protein